MGERISCPKCGHDLVGLTADRRHDVCRKCGHEFNEYEVSIGESSNRPRALPPSREGGPTDEQVEQATKVLAGYSAIHASFSPHALSRVAREVLSAASVLREGAATPEPVAWRSDANVQRLVRYTCNKILRVITDHSYPNGTTGVLADLDALCDAVAAVSRDGSEGREQNTIREAVREALTKASVAFNDFEHEDDSLARALADWRDREYPEFRALPPSPSH